MRSTPFFGEETVWKDAVDPDGGVGRKVDEGEGVDSIVGVDVTEGIGLVAGDEDGERNRRKL